MKIPEQVLLDKMHTKVRGAQENLNNLWLNPNFSHKPWYIGSLTLRYEIDKRLSSVKYPMEFHWTTKCINQFNTLKCSELENMEFYIGIFIFFNRYLVVFLVSPYESPIMNALGAWLRSDVSTEYKYYKFNSLRATFGRSVC